MPTLAMVSEPALPVTPTDLAQQNSASASASPDKNDVLNIVFGILATLTALLSVVVAYQQLVAMRQSSEVNSQPVELDATVSYADFTVASDEG